MKIVRGFTDKKFRGTYPFHHIFRVFDDHYVSGEHFFLEDERRSQILISRQVHTKHDNKNKLNVHNKNI